MSLSKSSRKFSRIALLWKRSRHFLRRFFLIHDTPARVAGGAALGVFLGIMPGGGLGTALVVSTLLHLNRLSATLAVIATNMWATILLLPLAAAIGGFLFREDPTRLINHFKEATERGFLPFASPIILFELLFPLVAGFALLSLAIAKISFLGLFLLLEYKHRYDKRDTSKNDISA